MLERLGEVPAGGRIADLGCSTGYLLEDLAVAYPGGQLIGVDLVAPGLAKAHGLVPDAWLLRADVCDLPLGDASIDAVVSANLLEHVPDDRGALREMFRVLAPGGRAVVVIPAGPDTYDYYDRFLGHERRYARGELAGKAREAGLEVLDDAYLGSLLYPGFWAVKKRNRQSLRRPPGRRPGGESRRRHRGHAELRLRRAGLPDGAEPAAARSAAPVRDPRHHRFASSRREPRWLRSRASRSASSSPPSTRRTTSSGSTSASAASSTRSAWTGS